MQEKPGVMIYFDIRDTLSRLSDESAGILFRAIMEYGATRNEPELPEPLYLLWPLIQMRLDTDDQRYHQVSQKRKYAAYVRWTEHHGQAPLSFEDWLCTLDHSDGCNSLPPS